jgi:hypothetical protein
MTDDEALQARPTAEGVVALCEALRTRRSYL